MRQPVCFPFSIETQPLFILALSAERSCSSVCRQSNVGLLSSLQGKLVGKSGGAGMEVFTHSCPGRSFRGDMAQHFTLLRLEVGRITQREASITSQLPWNFAHGLTRSDTLMKSDNPGGDPLASFNKPSWWLYQHEDLSIRNKTI